MYQGVWLDIGQDLSPRIFLCEFINIGFWVVSSHTDLGCLLSIERVAAQLGTATLRQRHASIAKSAQYVVEVMPASRDLFQFRSVNPLFVRTGCDAFHGLYVYDKA